MKHSTPKVVNQILRGAVVPDRGPEPQRRPQIAEQMDILHNLLQEERDVIDALAKRLGPALNTVPTKCDSEIQPPPDCLRQEPACEIAQALFRINLSLHGYVAVLRDLRDQLEI